MILVLIRDVDDAITGFGFNQPPLSREVFFIKRVIARHLNEDEVSTVARIGSRKKERFAVNGDILLTVVFENPHLLQRHRGFEGSFLENRTRAKHS